MVNKGMTMQGLGAIVVGILALVVIYTIIPVVGSQLDIAVTIPTNVYATGTFTFAGNVSNGELANITNGGSVYRFEFNTTNIASPICRVTDCIIVPVTNGWNTSVNLSGNLSAAINANASTYAIVTAVNGSGTTRLTAVTVGSNANTITLSDNAGNITSSGMSGGITGSQWDSVTNPSMPTAVDFWEALGAIVKVGGVIVVVGGFLQTLRGLRG